MAWQPPAGDAVQSTGWQPPASDAVETSAPWYQTASDLIGKTEDKLTPDVIKQVGSMVAQRPELQPYGMGQQEQPTTVIGSALQAAGQTLAAPIRTGATLSAGPDVLGEGISEGGRELGHPIRGALLGTAVQMSPYVLGAVSGYRSLDNSTNAQIAGRMNSTKELSPQYTAQNEAIGIQNRPPTQSGTTSVYPQPEMQGLNTKPPRPLVKAEPLPDTVPVKYPRDPGALITEATNRMGQFGTKLSPQVLADYKDLLDTNMNNGNIPKFQLDGRGNPIPGKFTKIYSQATQARAQAVDLLNQVSDQKLPSANLPEGTIPTRSGLNEAYGIAASREAIGRNIAKYVQLLGEGGGIIGGGVYGAKQIWDYLKK